MTWPRWWAWTAATPSASTPVTAAARQTPMTRAVAAPQARVAALEQRRAGRPALDGGQRGLVGAEGQELGRAGERVDHLGRQRAGEGGHLVVAAAPPGEQRRHGQRDDEGEAEGEGGPRQDQADRHRADHAGADGDRHREQRAQVEVLQGVDVVDGPRQQVAAAPPGQRGGHPRGEAVVEPDPPAGQARAERHRGRPAAPRSAAARAGRRAPRRRPGCRRSR